MVRKTSWRVAPRAASRSRCLESPTGSGCSKRNPISWWSRSSTSRASPQGDDARKVSAWLDLDLLESTANAVHRLDRRLKLVLVTREVFALVRVGGEIEQLVVESAGVDQLHARRGPGDDRAF